MPITFQEIGSRALAFSREWKHAESEGGKCEWASHAEGVPFLFYRYRERTSLVPGK